MAKYVNFTFPISAYHPDALQQEYSEKELRKEYARLRDIAQKRLKRLELSEFRDSQTVRYNKDRFIPTREISGIGELTHLLTDIARFLTASRSTVSGMKEYRKRSVENLHESGLTGITEKNFNRMTQILDWAEAFKEYDPSELVRMMNAAAEAGIDFNTVLENLAELYEEWIHTGSLDSFMEDAWDE